MDPDEITDEDLAALDDLTERALAADAELDARGKCLAEIDRRSAAMVEGQRWSSLRRD